MSGFIAPGARSTLCYEHEQEVHNNRQPKAAFFISSYFYPMKARTHANIFITLRRVAPLLAADVIFFNSVNPAQSSSFFIIAGCILLFTTLYLMNWLLARLLGLFLACSERTQRRLALCMTLLFCFLLLMQSIGQLDIRDALAAIPLAAAVYIYMSYVGREKLAKSSY